ncbi:hypothetical protein ACFV27_00725 [Streptomyces antimycoticus]|uniref:hypothetical protein n=1 Tax=Streptomyces antimycoticus TaxID=68175 RepID=UPI0036A0874F
MTANSEQQQQEQPPKGKAARVADLHRQAAEDYRDGEYTRERMDRAAALRRATWGTP